MLPKDHETIIRAISTNLTDQGKVNDLLQQLRDSNDTEYNAFTTLTEQNVEAVKTIGTLKENNMNLFLKVGHTSSQQTNEPPAEKIKTLEEIATEI